MPQRRMSRDRRETELKLKNLALAKRVPDKAKAQKEAEEAALGIQVLKDPPNRQAKRQMGHTGVRRLSLRRKPGVALWPTGPHARHNGPTGQPAHFVAWRTEGKVRKYLKSIRVSTLASKLIDTYPSVSKSLFLVADAFPTVHDLASADRAALLDLPGVGRVTIKRIHEYLTEHKVQMGWEL